MWKKKSNKDKCINAFANNCNNYNSDYGNIYL